MTQSSSVKRVKRLGGWHRIGITASILWLVVGAFWGHKVGDLEGYRAVVHWRLDCIVYDGVTKWDRDGNPIDGSPQASGGPAASPTTPVAPPPKYTIGDAPTSRPAASPTTPVAPPAGPWDKYIVPATGERLTESDWCIQESNKLWPAANRITWTFTALYALVPIVLGWPMAYVVRWIRTGFKVPTSPN